MSLEAVKTYVASQLEAAKKNYIQDLEAMSEEDLVTGVGGTERKGIDFTFETAFVNRRLATRMKGETPETWPADGWIVAPEEYRTKEAAITFFTECTDYLIATWNNIPSGEMLKVIPLPSGEETSPLDLAYSGCWHTGYHDAQLNYIQGLKGDLKVHWQ